MKKLLPIFIIIVLFSCKKSDKNTGLPDGYQQPGSGVFTENTDLFGSWILDSLHSDQQPYPDYFYPSRDYDSLSFYTNHYRSYRCYIDGRQPVLQSLYTYDGWSTKGSDSLFLHGFNWPFPATDSSRYLISGINLTIIYPSTANPPNGKFFKYFYHKQ